MKKIFFGMLFLSFFNVNSLIAGEITDMEWDIIDDLIVTYYTGSNKKASVNCRVYSVEDKVIAGASGYADAGVARVRIDVPKKYVRKKLSVSCE